MYGEPLPSQQQGSDWAQTSDLVVLRHEPLSLFLPQYNLTVVTLGQ